MAGVAEVNQVRIKEVLGFAHGTFPVRYLGIPLHFRSLKTYDFNMFLVKMTERIRGWLSRHVSYAGRVELIRFVLYGIQNF